MSSATPFGKRFLGSPEQPDALATLGLRAGGEIGTIDSGTANEVRTVLGVPATGDLPVQATETAAGIAEIATQGETNTGTDDLRFVTPLKLQGKIDGLYRVVQRVYVTDTTYRSLTATIPIDDTIPQSTEGTETLTGTIVPNDASNVLRVTIASQVNFSTANAAILGLFRDSGANAIAVGFAVAALSNRSTNIPLLHEESAGSTASTTFKIRIGPDTGTGGTIYVNGNTLGRAFGGVMKTTMLIEEIAP